MHPRPKLWQRNNAAARVPIWCHPPRGCWLLFLFLLLTSACGSSTSKVPTPTPTTTSTQSALQSSDLAVIVPVPAHPGDSVMVVDKVEPTYQPNGPSNQLIDVTISLYGTFPTLGALQTAIASLDSTVGPPTWQSRLPEIGGSYTIGGLDAVDLNTFSLPQTVTPGLYDLVVIVMLHGSQATARAE
jgi:hypothetical protein